MSTYKITALNMGETNVPNAEIYWMTKLTGWEPLTFWAFLIRNEKHTILVNTGFPQDYSALHKHWTTWAKSATGEEGHVPVVKAENWIVAALAAHGVAPSDVDYVFITPLTSYATGGLDQFPSAKIYMARNGWIDFHAPDPEIPQLPRHIIFPDHVLHWLVSTAAPRIHLLPSVETEVLPGIRTWFCGAHHRSSICLLIQTKSGRVALTDAIFKYGNYEEKIPLGLSESLEEHYRLYAKLGREADIVVPLYDPRLIERHKGGVIE